MSEPERIEAAKGLFAETAEGPRLLGSRCATCRTPYFPRSEACHNPDCAHSAMEDARFGPRGRLRSIALQNYPPPAPTIAPEPYHPYGVGLVDMPEGLRVIGRLVSDEPERVEVGSEVELVLAPLGHDAEGREVISWQWKPL
ncbi:MAG TPA: DNA-binding protein [Alphaproteobacteria bacterium]|nr:DNA-binding protein [Alphaproteobacteria bacterium]